MKKDRMVKFQAQSLVQTNLGKIEKKSISLSSPKFRTPISLTTSLIVIWVHNGPKTFSTTNFSAWPRISDLIQNFLFIEKMATDSTFRSENNRICWINSMKWVSWKVHWSYLIINWVLQPTI